MHNESSTLRKHEVTRTEAPSDANLLTAAVLCAVTFVRILVGFQPHSGQDNYHGAKAAYGGDFEAQRHWMELTLNLPIGEWYWYDLSYWGLDYPPLTAYVSWVCGYFSRIIVGPESVDLETSRGIEDETHKSFMRATVIVTDLLFYATAVWYTTMRSRNSNIDMSFVYSFVFAMVQPSIILIDHGHFQYNTTALGLALWSFYFVSKPGKFYSNCVIGSVLFSLALSFKQMTLYYAPAIFAYLLGRCFVDRGGHFVPRIGALGVTVIATFLSLWWPFVIYGPENTTSIERLVHVLRRIFPLERGLFEGKVSNIWCALSVKPISIRERIPEDLQPLASLLMTFFLIIPSCCKLFKVGQAQNATTAGRCQDLTCLLWGCANSALAFFLASFQVHEKSILIALAPVSLLWTENNIFVEWFSIVAAWSLWPLLVIDRLEVAYFCIMILFVSLLRLFCIFFAGAGERKQSPSNSLQSLFVQFVPALSYTIMIGLHTAEWTVPSPTNLPDMYPVLWSIVGCGFCCIAWSITLWHVYECCPGTENRQRMSKEKAS